MHLYPKTALVRYGGWLPRNREAYEMFFAQLSTKVSAYRQTVSTHIEAVADFERAVIADPEMVNLVDQMFSQAEPINYIEDFAFLLHCLDILLLEPPGFLENAPLDFVGTPLCVLFDVLSNTGAAYDLFRRPAFNVAMKKLLDARGAYLKSPESNKTLTDQRGGWFSAEGLETLAGDDRGEFNVTYLCPKPDEINRGFQSWNDFFTREIQGSARPIVSDANPDTILNACESAVFRLARNVKAHDKFWLKAQNYSLCDMLNGDECAAEHFAGGTIYQAYLSPYDYHRWRAPISGTIMKTEIIPGTYYAVLPDEGAADDDPNFEPGSPYGALVRSEAWITQSAARAVVYIQSDNPKIGLVAFIGVGMVEISTCVVSVEVGQRVRQGDGIGMFQFGGSSHVLIFGPDTNITFVEDVERDGMVMVNSHIKVRSVLGRVN